MNCSSIGFALPNWGQFENYISRGATWRITLEKAVPFYCIEGVCLQLSLTTKSLEAALFFIFATNKIVITLSFSLLFFSPYRAGRRARRDFSLKLTVADCRLIVKMYQPEEKGSSLSFPLFIFFLFPC